MGEFLLSVQLNYIVDVNTNEDDMVKRLILSKELFGFESASWADIAIEMVYRNIRNDEYEDYVSFNDNDVDLHKQE